MRKKSHVLRNILLVVIGVPLVALIVFVMTFDANTYRPQIAEALTGQLGREVKLDGPIKLSFSPIKGFHMSVENVSVANPAWASRPEMGKVGTLALGVALTPLLQHKIDVTSFDLKDADVQLESTAAGQSNWEFQTAKKGATPAPAAAPACNGKDCAKQAGQLPAFHVNEVNVTNSRFALRDKTGKTSIFMVNGLTFVPKGQGMELKLDAVANGMPVTVDLTGDKPLEALMTTKWPFDIDGHYANLDLKLKGTLDGPAKEVTDAYEIASGGSKITGNMTIAYGGARPDIKGTLTSDKLDPADFKVAPAEAAGGKEEPKKEEPKPAAAGGGQNRVFSTEPLQLDGLKAADAHLEVKIADLVMGPSGLKDLQTKLDLTNGRLLLSPFKAMVNDKAVEGQIKVDAEANPAQVLVMLKAYQIDLAQLVKLGGFSSFIESKGDADMDITTSGNSPHDLASNANGQINLVMAGGSVSTQELGSIAGDLLNVFAPGTGGMAKPGLNCMVAHLKVTNGQVETKGLLIDTSQATVLGTGGANLRDETIDMELRTRAKALDQVSSLTKGVDVNSLAPPLRISGPLAKPSYKPDTSGSIQKVVGLLQGGSLGGGDSGVPDVVAQAGQNACEYTLEHPKAGQSAQAPTTVQGVVDKAKDKIKDVGGKLLQGLGGMFGK